MPFGANIVIKEVQPQHAFVEILRFGLDGKNSRTFTRLQQGIGFLAVQPAVSYTAQGVLIAEISRLLFFTLCLDQLQQADDEVGGGLVHVASSNDTAFFQAG